MNPIYDVLTSLFKPVGDYFNRKQEIKAQEHDNQIKLLAAQGERAAQNVSEGRAADAAWELEQIRNSGWKDEYVLLLLSIPLILVFIPATQPAVLRGFEVLSQTPEWYRWLVVMIFAAIYGIRIWRRQQSDT